MSSTNRRVVCLPLDHFIVFSNFPTYKMDLWNIQFPGTYNTEETHVNKGSERRLTFIKRIEILRGHSIPHSFNGMNKRTVKVTSPTSQLNSTISIPRQLSCGTRISFVAPMPGNKPCQPWKVIASVNVGSIREDYYSTTLTSCSSWVHDPCQEESGLDQSHSDEAERFAIAALNELDEVNFVTTLGVHCWCQQLGFRSIIRISPSTYPVDVVVCVAKSKLGLVVTGHNNGIIEVCDLIERKRVCRATIAELVRSASGDASSYCATRGHPYPTHVLWISGFATPVKSPGNASTAPERQLERPMLSKRLNHYLQFFLGDSYGRVLRVGILNNKLVILEILKTTAYHHENICSMALDRTELKLAVTSTDSMVSVWTKQHDQENLPGYSKCIFAQLHNSAVRGLSFCPGSPYLLATGGGRHDRTLRVFHLDISELTFQQAMPGQIVALIWLSKWELFVGLGHSRVGNYRGLGKVINIATHTTVTDIPGDGYTLSAVKTANGMCLNSSMERLITFSWQCDSTSLIPSSKILQSPLSLPMPQFR